MRGAPALDHRSQREREIENPLPTPISQHPISTARLIIGFYLPQGSKGPPRARATTAPRNSRSRRRRQRRRRRQKGLSDGAAAKAKTKYRFLSPLFPRLLAFDAACESVSIGSTAAGKTDRSVFILARLLGTRILIIHSFIDRILAFSGYRERSAYGSSKG